MSFDPVSYAAGRKAGGKGGGREPVLETLSVTENGDYMPPEGVDGFSEVTVDVQGPVPVLVSLSVTENGTYTPGGVDGFSEVTVDVPASAVLNPLVDQASAGDILSGKEAYDDQGNVLSGSYVPHFQQLSDQASDGDLRYGRDAYDDQGNVISGTLRNLHVPGPIYWDAANAKFSPADAYIAQAMAATLAADGAITGYLVNSETSVPIPCVVHLDAGGNLILAGGVCIVDGSDTDKYVVYAQIGLDGSVSNEKCSLIRLAVTVSRHLSDWMADGDYLSLFLLA